FDQLLHHGNVGHGFVISTRAATDARPAAYSQLRQVAVSNGLSVNSVQKSETTLALKKISDVPAH
ncbi:MAG TPA: hypothetical protein VF772_10425, partial [Terriglobales bacterium]